MGAESAITGPIETDEAGHFVGAIFYRGSSQPAKPPEKMQRFFAGKKFLEVRVLRKKADGLAALYKPAITSKNFRAAARWRYQAENNFQRGAFTGAIRPQQPVHLARVDPKVQVLHRDDRLSMKRNGKNFG